jgi:hypothetical protein
MIPRFESGGGLIGQLRGYALRASDDGAWAEEIEQTSTLSRTVTPRHEAGDSVYVTLEARKTMARNVLRTMYVVRAAHIEEGLPIDFLPPYVIDVLRRNKVTANDNDNTVETLIINLGDDEEADTYGLDRYDEINFRHTRGIEYRLNGRGTLLSKTREDYYDDADGEVDIAGEHIVQKGLSLHEEAGTLSLKDWGEQTPPHERTNLDSIDEDLSFYSIVEHYSTDKRLNRYTQAEDRRAMHLMLAFLRLEASVKDIQDLL